jgi:2-keto-4-pentenoate hydratase/2-oxohepta-3-ene-1,7-dioic acid hydratase in catechol pathway
VRLLTYAPPGGGAARVGARIGERVLDLQAAAKLGARHVPSTLKALLHAGDMGMGAAREVVKAAEADAKKYASVFHDEASIRYYPPVPDLDKFLCVGKNYRAHLEELKKHDLIKEMPEEVTGFVKIHSCLTGHREKVVKPRVV